MVDHALLYADEALEGITRYDGSPMLDMVLPLHISSLSE